MKREGNRQRKIEGQTEGGEKGTDREQKRGTDTQRGTDRNGVIDRGGKAQREKGRDRA